MLGHIGNLRDAVNLGWVKYAKRWAIRLMDG